MEQNTSDDSDDMPADLLATLPRLRARARRLSPSATEAEDLLHDALVGYFEQQMRGRRIDRPAAYLMTALRHGQFHARRHAARQIPLEGAPEPQVADAQDALFCRQVLDAIAGLPDADAALLTLVVEGETSPAALARHLGLPVGTIMSRLARARARLRTAVGME